MSSYQSTDRRFMQRLRRMFWVRLLLCFSLAVQSMPAFAVFDPVNDDTDLFRNNPNIPSERPNVVIMVDNTANWNSAFTNEKAALLSVIAGLDDAFNVGLMSYPETGGGNDSIDGAYVRFAVRQMDATNKAALSSIVSSWDQTADKGNNSTLSLFMHEAYLYFAGLPSRATFGKVKSDITGNTGNAATASLGNNALPAGATSATAFNSAISNNCQKNYIIYISNGPANENSSALGVAEGLLKTASAAYTAGSTPTFVSTTSFTVVGDQRSTYSAGKLVKATVSGSGGSVTGTVASSSLSSGNTLVTLTMDYGALTGISAVSYATAATPSTISISPNGMQSNWADEYAKFMANADVNATQTGTQSVTTYVVEVDRGTQNQDLAMTALMQSMAINGKGKYFNVTSGSSGQAIIDALNSIFQEIQAVNSVFAASTLPVSVNVRGTNLNQLYIGVFRPDSLDRPRWFGNLKAYQLKKDAVTGAVFTVDANGNQAENSTTGFITDSAVSFWTSTTLNPTDYWSFRPASQNGVGGSSDSPDGDLVEKGGAGQQIRSKYFTSGVNDLTNFRPVYTCTQGTPVCGPGSLLSATPFADANVDITAGDLRLSTRDISPLSAAIVKSVTALSDTRDLAITNALGGVTVTGITNPVVSKSLSGIDNSKSVTVTLNNSANPRTLTNIVRASGNNKAIVVTVPVAGFGVGTQVAITGTSANYLGTYTIEKVNASSIELTKTGNFAIAAETSGTVTTSSSNVTATASGGHGFGSSGTVSVTIANATPANFNGTKTATITSATQFTWTGETAPAALPSGTIEATVRSTTATATLSTAHGYTAGQSVTIAGATPTGYNGSFSIASVPSTTTFTYTMGSTPTSSATGTMTSAQSGTSATVTAPGHTFVNGASVSISSATPAAYNNTYTIANVAGDNFDITVPSGTGNLTGTAVVTSGGATSSVVTATLANHGFAASDSITIGGVTTTGHNGTWTVLAVPDTSTFTYSTVTNLAAPAGAPTVRLTSNPKAYATITSHGYGAAGTSVANLTISGAIPNGATAGYNGTYTATVIDDNTISYVLSAGQGAQTGTAVTATTPSTTATATSASHGYTAGTSVTIAGASPSAFNGTFTVVSAPTPNTFTYTLGSAQTTASGGVSGITVSSGTATAEERTAVINWVRGEDNYEDENANTSLADTRTTIQGDVLHSRPAVVNYNRRTDTGNIDNDVYIFYGGNDGIFRALKGGFGSSPGDPTAGLEVWGFVVPEHFSNLRRLRLNSPSISSSNKKPYFFDGPIGTYTLDANGDGKLVAADGDKVYLYLTMRRGGRFMYALDVSDPLIPKLLWRKGCPSFDASLGGACDTGWEELGQTWSEPKIVSINASTDPVLMFGAGYDASVEDIDPSTVTSSTTSAVVTASGTTSRSQGRGIYVVNALTGAIIWQASGHARVGSSSHPYKVVSGMDYAIPSDIAVVVGDSTPKPFRSYVGDTGGQMWRIDFGDADPANWTVHKLGSIADQTTASKRRKFMFPPDVIGGDAFHAVIAGTGDREHPFDTTIANRVYMFKDKAKTTTPPFDSVTGLPLHATITEGTGTGAPMFDVTSNCIQDASGCTGTAPQAAGGGFTASQNAANALNDSTNFGWYLSLASGEKQVGGTVASGAGAVQFGTNQPSASAGGGACSPNLGVARKYTISFADGSAFSNLDATSSALTSSDRSVTHAGGGYLPSPVLVFVGLGGATGTGSTTTTGVPVGGEVSGTQLKVGGGTSLGNDPTGVVCFGASCGLAPGVQLYSRLRKFWYKELD